jgi:hypothetical protein
MSWLPPFLFTRRFLLSSAILLMLGGGAMVSVYLNDTFWNRPSVTVGPLVVEDPLPTVQQKSVDPIKAEFWQEAVITDPNGVSKQAWLSKFATPPVFDEINGKAWIFPVRAGWIALPIDQWNDFEALSFIVNLMENGIFDIPQQEQSPQTFEKEPEKVFL